MSDSRSWTHPSVLKLAKGRDPVLVATDAAQRLVLRAREQGWGGPPFDPIALANFVNVTVRPSDSVQDARTSATAEGPVIEFNPSRPRRRVRFSIAHELAHMLFPDWADEPRHRFSKQETSPSQWQLETLCNLAASEFLMPLGSFQELREEPIDIHMLLRLREHFEVSTEAMLLRVVRLTRSDMCIFAASRHHSGFLRLDYVVGSHAWRSNLAAGQRLPSDSVVHDCIAIGFTTSGVEHWPNEPIDLEVHSVGIPPHPGQAVPRVIGIAKHISEKSKEFPQIIYRLGDATQIGGTGHRILAHVVNDKSPIWGRGFGLALRRRHPIVQRAFQKWVAEHRRDFRLGNVRTTRLDRELTVAHLISQHGFGTAKHPAIRYGALVECLIKLAEVARRQNASVHMPRIGTGEGAAAWSIISELIEDRLCSKGISVVVYDLPGQARNPQATLDFRTE